MTINFNPFSAMLRAPAAQTFHPQSTPLQLVEKTLFSNYQTTTTCTEFETECPSMPLDRLENDARAQAKIRLLTDECPVRYAGRQSQSNAPMTDLLESTAPQYIASAWNFHLSRGRTDPRNYVDVDAMEAIGSMPPSAPPIAPTASDPKK